MFSYIYWHQIGFEGVRYSKNPVGSWMRNRSHHKLTIAKTETVCALKQLLGLQATVYLQIKEGSLQYLIYSIMGRCILGLSSVSILFTILRIVLTSTSYLILVMLLLELCCV